MVSLEAAGEADFWQARSDVQAIAFQLPPIFSIPDAPIPSQNDSGEVGLL